MGTFPRQRRSLVAAIFGCRLAGSAAIGFGWIEVAWDEGLHVRIARPMSSESAQRIAGDWSGEGADTPGNEPIPYYKYKLRFHFTVNGRTLKLDGDYEIADAGAERRLVRGTGEVRDDYARLMYEYRSEKNSGAIGYGVLLLHIPLSGDRVEGWWLSRSMQHDAIKGGTFELKRASR